MLDILVSSIGDLSHQLSSLSSSISVIVSALGAISLSVSGGAAWLSAILPLPKSTGIYFKIHGLISVVGGNVGNATNLHKMDKQ